MTEETVEVNEEVLSMPTDIQANASAECVSNEKKCVRRKTSEGLFGRFSRANYGVLNGLWNVGVVGEILL